MMVWNKLSIQSRYYIISFLNLGVWWGFFTLINIEFINIIFFLTAYVWHFALLTPGLKEKVMTNHHKLSFLAVVVRLNHYLQIFINIKKLPYSSSFVRALSPAIFTFILFMAGGTGNILFTFLGSFAFEVVYLIVKKKMDLVVVNPVVHASDLDTPPAIPNDDKN